MEDFEPLLFGEGEEEFDKMILYVLGEALIVAVAIGLVVYLVG